MVETALIAFAFGMLGGLLVGWRDWRRFAVELRYHGLDNHRCNRVGCCR